MSFQFDFALSFSGSDRALAEEIRDGLRSEGLTVFYDRDFEHEMVGRDGTQYLRRVYSRKSRHCVVLISEEYEQHEWTQLERESIQARELRGEEGALIPVLVDGHIPEWLSPTRIYIDLQERSREDLLEVLVRMRRTESQPLAAQSVRNVESVFFAIEARGTAFMNQCRGHLKFALQDGFVRIRLGYSSTKTEAGRALIELGALEMLEDRPTGSTGTKYKITGLGTRLLHRLQQGRAQCGGASEAGSR